MNDDQFKNYVYNFLSKIDTRGLFQTNQPVGLIFAVIKDENGINQYTPIPCHNDCRGENVALKLMKQSDFVCWAVDPWSGQINLKIVKEE